MCQYLPPTQNKLIKSNNSFQVTITCLHKFKFDTSFNVLLYQNNRSEIEAVLNLPCSMVPGV